MVDVRSDVKWQERAIPARFLHAHLVVGFVFERAPFARAPESFTIKDCPSRDQDVALLSKSEASTALSLPTPLDCFGISSIVRCGRS